MQIIKTQITPWETVTLTGSFNTNCTYTGKMRYVGENMEVVGQIAFTGAPNAVQATINIPQSKSIDTSKMPAANSDSTRVGDLTFDDSGVGTMPGHVYYRGATAVSLKCLDDAAGSTHYESLFTEIVPVVIASGDKINFAFSVPIVGRGV